MIKLKLAQLHGPIFVGGKNQTERLKTEKNEGLTMFYDREEKELHVSWNNETAIVPSTNIMSMVAADPVIVTPVEPKIQKNLSAQVDTPQSHVFAGAGAGKTGLGSKP